MNPIRIIAGLGNPTRQHERDRHNVGFWFVEHYAAAAGVGLAKDAKYQALTGKQAGAGGDVWLVMPQTYMNLSGRSVGGIARFYKIAPEQILVIHDELDFPPGQVKMKLGGGVAGHNGLRDIAAQLGSPNFWRLRIGIGHPGDRSQVGDWVLGSPSPAHREAIDACIERGIEVMPLALAGDMEGAMQKLHTTKPPRPKPPRPEAGQPKPDPAKPGGAGAT